MMADTAQDQFDDDRAQESQEKRDIKVIESHVVQLMEHFDNVQIFATRLNTADGTTATVQIGDGNWYARYGHVKEWVTREEERARYEVRGG